MEKKVFGQYKNRRLRTTGPAGVSPTSFYNLEMEQSLYDELMEYCDNQDDDVSDWIVKHILLGLYKIKNDCAPAIRGFQKIDPQWLKEEPPELLHKYYNFSINGAILHEVKDICFSHGMKRIDPWICNQIKIGLGL